jgi:hypothetical protein
MSLEGVCVDEKATKKRSKNDELPTESCTYLTPGVDRVQLRGRFFLKKYLG